MPMGSRTIIIKLYLIAGTALAAAIAVYLFARSQPPLFLPRLDWLNGLVVVDGKLFSSAPSFFYTLAFGLLIGLASPAARAARINCLLWIVLALGLELTQLSALSRFLIDGLQPALPARAWEWIGPYWIHGVFDTTDLLATLGGGLLAWVMLRRLSGGNNNDSFDKPNFGSQRFVCARNPRNPGIRRWRRGEQ